MALGKIGVPITFDKSRNAFLPISEDDVGYIDFNAEMRGDTAYSSGRIYIGQDVYAGLSREQTGAIKVPVFIKYTITIKGGSLGSPIEKTFEVSNSGEHSWDNVMLSSGLGKGKYTVSLFLHAQYTKQDGTGMILNNNAGFLEIER